jgi:phage tail sheath protein FI
MFLQKSLKPTLELFLEEPNDIPTWKRIYYTVKPFLDSMVNKRALYSYSWDGDQDAKNMQSLVINNSSDVTDGKYKVRFGIQAIPSIQEISVDIVMTEAGVSFELVGELI